LRLAHDVESGNGRPARVRTKQRGEDADRGGLARAIRSKQAQDAALFDRQIDSVESADLGLA
jgi:hypothetical protein